MLQGKKTYLGIGISAVSAAALMVCLFRPEWLSRLGLYPGDVEGYALYALFGGLSLATAGRWLAHQRYLREMSPQARQAVEQIRKIYKQMRSGTPNLIAAAALSAVMVGGGGCALFRALAGDPGVSALEIHRDASDAVYAGLIFAAAPAADAQRLIARARAVDEALSLVDPASGGDIESLRGFWLSLFQPEDIGRAALSWRLIVRVVEAWQEHPQEPTPEAVRFFAAWRSAMAGIIDGAEDYLELLAERQPAPSGGTSGGARAEAARIARWPESEEWRGSPQALGAGGWRFGIGDAP